MLFFNRLPFMFFSASASSSPETLTVSAECPWSRRAPSRKSTWLTCASSGPTPWTEWPAFTRRSSKTQCKDVVNVGIMPGKSSEFFYKTLTFVPPLFLPAGSRISMRWTLTSSKIRPMASLLGAGWSCATPAWQRSLLRSVCPTLDGFFFVCVYSKTIYTIWTRRILTKCVLSRGSVRSTSTTWIS